MKMIAQNAEKVQMADTISHFMKRFRGGNLLKACNAYKEKGVSVVRLFIYMLQMVFADRKATKVMVELLTSALKAGIKAKYVLFDSWFASRSRFCTSKRWAWTPSGW